MHRIGRDGAIPNFTRRMDKHANTLVMVYGEIDCRCHIERQKQQGRHEDDIIKVLSEAYMRTLTKQCRNARRVIVVAVIPPVRRSEYEKLNGPITHAFPILGTDKDRIRYREKLNECLQRLCHQNERFHYIDPYLPYMNKDGALNYTLSDGNIHIGQPEHVLQMLDTFLHNLDGVSS